MGTAILSPGHLIGREIVCRKLGFALGVLAVGVAAGCAVGAATLLRGYDTRAERALAAKERALNAQMQRMQDAYRKIMKRMGFNILILPAAQDLSDFYAEHYAREDMPESYADRLAESRVFTIRHLLPMLQQKVEWPEHRRSVLLIGTRGEVPLPHRIVRKPIDQPVPAGCVVLGYELHRSLGFRAGDELVFRGRAFRVHACHGQRGTKDDISLWVDLAAAQEILGKPGRINAIMALQCRCAFADVSKVREEVARVLPETKVIELAGKALARAEARGRAAAEAQAALAREKRARRAQQMRRNELAVLVLSVVALACAGFVGFLSFLNTRNRRSEIGLLRALGVSRARILAVFLGKAALAGVIGGCLGLFAGFFAAWADPDLSLTGVAAAYDVPLAVGVLFAAVLLSVVACWLPALPAVRRDPARVLMEE